VVVGFAAISASLTAPPNVGDISHWFPVGCQYRKVGTGAGGGVLPPSLPPILLELEDLDPPPPPPELEIKPPLELEPKPPLEPEPLLDLDQELELEEELRELEEEDPVLTLVIGMLIEPELEV